MSANCLIYLTSYCNMAHNTKTGMPVGHQCRKLPVKMLQAEMDNNFELAQELLATTRKGDPR